MRADPSLTGMDPRRLDRIAEHVERGYLEPGKIAGCQVAVWRHGQPAYQASLGRMDRERAKPMAEDAIFRIYSMTKPITSVALMALYERGFFQLDDPVWRYLPDWRNQRVWVSGRGEAMELARPNRPLSFRHLLSHSGGLTYGTVLEQMGIPPSGHPVDEVYRELGVRRGEETLEQMTAKLAHVPLRYQPGERWMYSLSTDVCARLVEVISGQRFDHFLKDAIFDPLGMADTGFTVPPDKLDRFAACYARVGRDKQLRLVDDPQASPYRHQPTFLSGGGGLVGTTADYLRFCEMLRRGGELDGARILGPRTLELMRRNHLFGGQDLKTLAVAGFSETAQEGVGFGLGFATTLDSVAAGVPGAGDLYWGGAASTVFWVDPHEDLSVVFMTQLIPSGAFNFRGQLKSLIYSAIVD